MYACATQATHSKLFSFQINLIIITFRSISLARATEPIILSLGRVSMCGVYWRRYTNRKTTQKKVWIMHFPRIADHRTKLRNKFSNKTSKSLFESERHTEKPKIENWKIGTFYFDSFRVPNVRCTQRALSRRARNIWLFIAAAVTAATAAVTIQMTQPYMVRHFIQNSFDPFNDKYVSSRKRHFNVVERRKTWDNKKKKQKLHMNWIERDTD